MFNVQILTNRLTIQYHLFKSLSKIFVTFSDEICSILMRVYVLNCICRSNVYVFVHLYLKNTETDADLKRISISRALLDLIEDQLRFTLRNFQYNHDVNRSEDTRSSEINMNGRINDIDSVRWRVSVVICIVFEEYRYADVLLIVTLRIYSSVLVLIRRASSVCLAEMMSIRKESHMSTWTLRDRRTPSCPWSRSSGICDPLSAFHSRGLMGRFTNSRSRVKFEWSDLRESTDQKRKFSKYNEQYILQHVNINVYS